MLVPLLPYRHISGPDDEGPEFLRVLDEVARFYIEDMRGRPRLDGPDARMKFTRDWEYPWTLLRAGAHPGCRILDCGAGYSPLPFLWAAKGARVEALDRDVVIASRARYALWCAGRAIDDLRAEFAPHRAPRTDSPPPETAGRRPATLATRAPSGATRRRGRLGRFVAFHAARNRERLARLSHPDFWGPVSPALLRRYGVRYTHGDLTRLPYADASFDAVTCVSVLEHMPRDARLAGVREMTRVLAPGGRLVLTYDVVDGDITEEIVAASGGTPRELVYFDASKRLYAANAPDVIGVVIDKAGLPRDRDTLMDDRPSARDA